MNLTRTKILEGNYEYPSHFVTLKYTNHFLERLEERGMGINFVPTKVRVTKDNIHSGKTKDGRRLHSIVVRLSYTDRKYIFLAFNPFDGRLKSLWFMDKKRRG